MFPGKTREDIANILQESGVDPAARAETLTADAFLRVYNRLQ
jgi:16S rRNA A1518/A1519 N6-dimethyltransferase RsmA/KsgA/DIM1 with predicted DNA glycosylase/AP lyase activity